MKLRHLAIALAAGALAGLTGLTIYAAYTWSQLNEMLTEQQLIADVHARAVRMSNAVDYITLLRVDPQVLAAVEEDAETLQAELAAIDDAAAREAARHLGEMAHMAGALQMGDAAPESGHVLATQMRVYESALMATLEGLRAKRERDLINGLARALIVFIVAAVTFAVLCVAGFTQVQRRLNKPLHRIEEGIQALTKGVLETRVDIRSHDELGELASYVNSLADERQRSEEELRQSEERLRERMKELHCLYQVLKLTTGDEQPLERVYQSVADLLPSSLVHADDAVARLCIGRKIYHSGNWRKPAVPMTAQIAREGEMPGTVEVGYLSAHAEAPADGEGPFLKEERSLLDGVASHIERMLHGRHMAESLLQSQRLESVGQLTGGVAHDFNNLLTVIIGNTELLQEQLDDDDLAAMAEMIANAAHRGAELTHRLLAFARRQPLEPKPLDLAELVANVDPLLRRTLGEHIDIKTTSGDDLWLASADPAQLESALLNLALNARDAMPGGGRLTIETRNVTLGAEYVTQYPDLEEGQYVMLAVSDTGSGIPAEDLRRVFEPFYTTKEAGKGTGLGLSMVYGFAKQSRGHVNIYSEVGQGTTVKLYLPRARQDEQVIDAEQKTFAGGGSETILVVEDDDLVRQYVQKLLKSLGYNVLTANNGNAALQVLDSSPEIDLLFTDVVMPGGMSGRELADEVQSRHPDIRVLYTSGYSDNAIVHHGRLDPSVILLSKPYRREDLAASVRKALSTNSSLP